MTPSPGRVRAQLRLDLEGNMRKVWVIGLLAAWCCRAQPPQMKTPIELSEDLQRELRGLREQAEDLAYRQPSTAPERPTGESISITQLRHKVPKDARKSFE